MSERKTRFQKAMAGSFDNVDVFTNINEIRKLGNEIELLDVINPTSCTYGKIAALLSRVKALKEFELLSDGENLFINHPN